MKVMCNRDCVKLGVSSDLHFLSKKLYDNGKAFRDMYYHSDGKQIKNGEKLIDQMLLEVQQQQLDAILLTGDLTLNGELKSHEELVEKLKIVKKSGIPIFVVPGNHDIGHPNAKGYRKEETYQVQTIREEEFLDLYEEFGYAQAISKDAYSLSYAVPFSKRIWLICLDNCCRLNGKPLQYGQMKEESLEWLEEKLQEARSWNAYPLVMGHYNLALHNRIFQDHFTMRNHEKVGRILKKYQVPVFLSGHMHMQHMERQNGILDIATSSPCTYPHQYGILTVTDGKHVIYQTRQVIMSRNERCNYRRFYYNNFMRQVMDELEMASQIPGVIKIEMAAYAARMNLYYFSGSFYKIQDEVKNAHGWKLWQQYGESFYFYTYLKSILDDSMKNHNIYVQ